MLAAAKEIRHAEAENPDVAPLYRNLVYSSLWWINRGWTSLSRGLRRIFSLRRESSIGWDSVIFKCCQFPITLPTNLLIVVFIIISFLRFSVQCLKVVYESERMCGCIHILEMKSKAQCLCYTQSNEKKILNILFVPTRLGWTCFSHCALLWVRCSCLGAHATPEDDDRVSPRSKGQTHFTGNLTDFNIK